VVKYRVDATDAQKRFELINGLGMIAAELVDLGLTLEQVDEALDNARTWAEDEASANAAFKGNKNG
jgi:hypothetical protein